MELVVQVAWQCEPRQDWQLYLSPLGGQASDAIIALNAQAGKEPHFVMTAQLLYIKIQICLTPTCQKVHSKWVAENCNDMPIELSHTDHISKDST